MAVTITKSGIAITSQSLSGGEWSAIDGGSYKTKGFKEEVIQPGYIEADLSEDFSKLSEACTLTNITAEGIINVFKGVAYTNMNIDFKVQVIVHKNNGDNDIVLGDYALVLNRYCFHKEDANWNLSREGSVSCRSASGIRFQLQFEGKGGYVLTERTATIKSITVGYTRTRACYITFKGDGITETKTMYDYGTVPSYGSTPTRVGYDFIGWKSGGTTYTGALPAAGEQDVTYTAVWDIAFVVINYIGNGATSGEQARITQQRDISCTLESNWFERKYAVQLHHNDGKDTVETLYSSADFLGWYTAAEGGTKVGDSGDSYTPTNDINLYAHWSAMKAVTLETITRKGYTFLGWYTDPEGGAKVADGGASYTPTEMTVSLYAQWRSNAINQFRIGSKSPGFYLGQTPVFKIFKGATEIYYNPFVKDTLVSLPYGSKIKFGSYPTTEEKLVWFIVDKGHTGYPLGSVTLMTKQSVANLCFDNDEPNNDNVKAQRGGNPRYSLSNISQWLNAQELQGWFVKQHEADAEPNYASQAGFLSCFDAQEINAILNTTINIPVPNFETSNFLTCDVMETKVFLPSSTEVGDPSYGDRFNREETSYIFRHLSYDDKPSDYFWTRTAYGQSNELFLFRQKSNGVRSASMSCNVQPIINLSGFLDVSESPDSDGCYTVIF